MTDENPSSPKLPGGNLVSATLNRRVMALADRGRASGMVGARWADLAAAHAVSWPGSIRPIPGQPERSFDLQRVVRLDARPEIAARASKRSLQNPDLLFVGVVDGKPALQAADAKFSVETARAKQVSGVVVASLMTLGDVITDLLPASASENELVDGLFLCPDFLLTHLMFRRGYGVVRTTVKPEQVALVPVEPAGFFAPLDGASLIPVLAAVDELPVSPDHELTAGLYYFRLARAVVGCGIDATAPLLGSRGRGNIDETKVLPEATQRAMRARSAYELILEWNADVDLVRRQREAVDRVAGFPIRGLEVRALIEAHHQQTGHAVPTVNQVRRRLGGWYRQALVDQIGPMEPPISDLNAALARLALVAKQVATRAESETRRIIAEMSLEPDAGTHTTEPAATATSGG